MSEDQDYVGPSQKQLIHWIQISGENDNIDAKGPMTWDGAEDSAALSKDIVAFANSRDGGIIVIGKSEVHNGFEFTGLSTAQAASFETTKASQWVSSRFSPPPRFACYRTDFQHRTFVIIVVQEFEDIPCLCVKSFESSGKGSRHIIREGNIYIRNGHASSAPIRTAEELRQLIGLATRKKGDDLLAHFDAMLKGESPILPAFENDRLGQERQSIEQDLELEDFAGWYFSLAPLSPSEISWRSKVELERVISQHSVVRYNRFPMTNNFFPMEWGIANSFGRWWWALTYSGLFQCGQGLVEDQEGSSTIARDYDAPPSLPPGKWLEYTWSISTVAQYFEFASRFVRAFKAGQRFKVQVTLSPLKERQLISSQLGSRFVVGHLQPCRVSQFTYSKVVKAEDLLTSWESLSANSLKRLFDLFPDVEISEETILKWIDRYKLREI